MRHFLIIILAGIVFGGCNLPFIGPAQSALQVNSSPNAGVYLNGNHVGQTPLYNDKIKSGEYTIRLTVEGDPSKDWQTMLTLSPRIVTVINHSFGTRPEESANYILQLEPLPSKTATEVTIVTTPDKAVVTFDGQPQGYSPVSLTQVSPGDHTVGLSLLGYQDLNFNAQVKAGYKLIITAQLARASLPISDAPSSPTATVSGQLSPESDTATSSAQSAPTPKSTPTVTPKTTPTPSPKTVSAEPEKPYVVIKETGTGWLRVRSEPNGNLDNEVAKVDVGDKLPFIEANDSGWYQIEYAAGKTGWIVSRYAQLVQ